MREQPGGAILPTEPTPQAKAPSHGMFKHNESWRVQAIQTDSQTDPDACPLTAQLAGRSKTDKNTEYIGHSGHLTGKSE